MYPVRETLGLDATRASCQDPGSNSRVAPRTRLTGARDGETGQHYYGRGHVQLTWRSNYELRRPSASKPRSGAADKATVDRVDGRPCARSGRLRGDPLRRHDLRLVHPEAAACRFISIPRACGARTGRRRGGSSTGLDRWQTDRQSTRASSWRCFDSPRSNPTSKPWIPMAGMAAARTAEPRTAGSRMARPRTVERRMEERRMAAPEGRATWFRRGRRPKSCLAEAERHHQRADGAENTVSARRRSRPSGTGRRPAPGRRRSTLCCAEKTRRRVDPPQRTLEAAGGGR